MKLKVLAIGALVWIAACSGALAQCNGQSPSGYACGNPGASQGIPSFVSMSSLLDRAFASTQGMMLSRNGSGWIASVSPALGVNGGSGGSLVLNGSTSGSGTISVAAAAGSVLFQLPTTNGTNNQVLTTDGSGHLSWVSLTGTGTVTSVGLAMPASVFGVTGSPVTVAGTLTASLNTQNANAVWAGPTTGSAATPTFRTLVGADLPDPTLSALGGVQANSPVSHQWINAINTSGVPQLSQPAFTDISGTATGSQLPNPSATTLGGIESYASVAHQWINQISTLGVPSSTQPAFSDISGNATLAQLPNIGNNSVLGNNSGGSATPSSLSVSSVLDMVGATQGNVLYRGASGWVVLAPGTSGQVLTTGGAAANPSWTTVTGTGTVTSVGTGTGLTGGAITTTGTISLASISTGNVLANTSGVSAAPTPTTPSSVLDVIGSTEGNILYRGALNWSVLAPGTSGQFLQTPGAGSTPSWASAVTSITAGTGLSGGTITTTGTVALALNNATLQGSPSNPTGTTSLSGVMMGLGSTCKLTPTYSGRIKFEFLGVGTNTSTGNNFQVSVKYGTGAAPSNGASPTGTQVASNLVITAAAALENFSFANGGIITGLTPGTAYWFDIQLAVNGGTGSVLDLSCNAFEF